MALVKEVKVQHPDSKKLWDWPLQNEDGVVKVVNEADRFEVALQTRYFTPKEIQVKVIGDKVSIMCSHTERSENSGLVTREVNRVYAIPPGVKIETIESHLNEDGMLIISGKK